MPAATTLRQVAFILAGVSFLSGCDDGSKGKYERMASAEHVHLARRMDKQSDCADRSDYKAAVGANHDLARAAKILFGCMAQQGYVYVADAKGCGHSERSLKTLWVESITAECYRSKDPNIRKLEDAEPERAPFLGAP